MTDHADTERHRTLFKWDGTIPAWGIVLIGITFAVYVINWQADIEKRLTIREQSAGEYRKRVESLETQQRDQVNVLAGMRSDILVVKELLLRAEKRWDNNQGQQRP